MRTVTENEVWTHLLNLFAILGIGRSDCDDLT